MTMNHRARAPRPGPDCASFADLLALAGHERLDTNDAGDLRQHLATCGYCQHELHAYNRLDDLLRHHFGPLERGPLSRREIALMMRDGDEMPARRSAARPSSMALRELPQHSRDSVAIGNARPPRQQAPKRSRRLISTISAVAAVLVITLVTAALFASRSHVISGTPKKPTATLAPTATLPAYPPYTPTNGDLFNSITMVSPNEGWIAGSASLGQGNFEMLLLHYINGRFFKVPVSAVEGVTTPLNGVGQVVMLSASDGWANAAINSTACLSSAILHYTGGRWKQETTLASAILTLSMTSPTDGWAGGVQPPAAGVEPPCNPDIVTGTLYHYNGTTWTKKPVPTNTLEVDKVAMTSATDGWAIGLKQDSGSGTNPGQLLHYDGKNWAEVSIPGLAQLGLVQFANIAMISATDGWLAGTIYQSSAAARHVYYAGAPSRSVLFHYDGKQWSKVSTPLDTIPQGTVNSLSLAPSGDGWLVGAALGSGAFFLHLTNGTWQNTVPPTGASTTQVFAFSADDAWAIGQGDQGDPFLLHYHSGAWANVSLTPALHL